VVSNTHTHIEKKREREGEKVIISKEGGRERGRKGGREGGRETRR